MQIRNQNGHGTGNIQSNEKLFEENEAKRSSTQIYKEAREKKTMNEKEDKRKSR